MNKVELEAKVDALMDEINFLRAFYEAVRDAGALSGGLEAGTHPHPTTTTPQPPPPAHNCRLFTDLLPLHSSSHLWIVIPGADPTLWRVGENEVLGSSKKFPKVKNSTLAN